VGRKPARGSLQRDHEPDRKRIFKACLDVGSEDGGGRLGASLEWAICRTKRRRKIKDSTTQNGSR